jgi:hypothetical protein
MSNVNGYPEVCVDCGKRRTCDRSGQCHECRVNEEDQLAREDTSADFSQFNDLASAERKQKR